jgi:hypothetical protein
MNQASTVVPGLLLWNTYLLIFLSVLRYGLPKDSNPVIYISASPVGMSINVYRVETWNKETLIAI